MREMVYDDTRWVQRLQLMNCWDEGEARRRAEVAREKASGSVPVVEVERVGIGVNGVNGALADAEIPARSSITLFDANEEQGSRKTRSRKGSAVDGFDAIVLSPTSPQEPLSTYKSFGSALTVFSKIRSMRGFARQEYGRVHGAFAPFYNDVVASESHMNAIVFRTYRDPNRQARMLSNISRFAKSDISQGWPLREAKLEALKQAFETAVAKEFEHGLIDGDVEGKMRKYAHVLASLNGGAKAVDMFISRSQIIAEKQSMGNPLGCLNTGSFSMENSYRFFSNVSSAFNEQVTVIDRIFPSSVNAVIPFLHRIGREVISEYLTTLFDEARGTSMEAYLKALSTTYSQSQNFAKSLQPSINSDDTFDHAIDDVITKAFEPHIDLYLIEEMSFFKRNSEGQVADWERKLSEQDATMQSMYMSNVNRQADKRDFLASFKKVVMMPVNVLPTFPMSSPFGSKPATAKALVNGESLDIPLSASQNHTRSSSPNPLNAASLSIPRSSSPLPEPPTTELAAKAAIMNSRLEGIRSLFSIEIALNLVHAAKSSIERAAVFTTAQGHFGEDARKQCELIFILLLQILGTRHIKAGFDQAVSHLSSYNPRSNGDTAPQGQLRMTPLVTFLELVNVGDLIQQMLDVFYEQELIATHLTDRSDFLSPALKEKKRFEQMLDERVAAGLNKGIEVLMAEVEYVCATTQQPADFNPPEAAAGTGSSKDSGIADVGPSDTARQIVDTVASHTKMLVGSTDKTMLDVFNQEVGLRLFTALCKHLKRQRISVAGSIKLIRYLPLSLPPPTTITNPPASSDMSHYATYIHTLKNPSLTAYFTALRALAQIYLVAPTDAKELAAIIADGERFGGVFRAEEVYEFAERRADWWVVRKGVERAMYGVGCGVM